MIFISAPSSYGSTPESYMNNIERTSLYGLSFFLRCDNILNRVIRVIVSRSIFWYSDRMTHRKTHFYKESFIYRLSKAWTTKCYCT